jgi:hypothetical protein
MDCIKFTSVQLNEGLQCIQGHAFFNCESLSNIAIPSTLTAIKRHAFENCRKLTTMQLNVGLRIIEYRAFYNCASIVSVTVPSTVPGLCELREGSTTKSIGLHSFRFCLQLVTERGVRTNWVGCISWVRFTADYHNSLHCQKG